MSDWKSTNPTYGYQVKGRISTPADEFLAFDDFKDNIAFKGKRQQVAFLDSGFDLFFIRLFLRPTTDYDLAVGKCRACVSDAQIMGIFQSISHTQNSRQRDTISRSAFSKAL
jgi:hypothetical protein